MIDKSRRRQAIVKVQRSDSGAGLPTSILEERNWLKESTPGSAPLRADLQALCRNHGLKSGGKNSDLLQRLDVFYEQQLESSDVVAVEDEPVNDFLPPSQALISSNVDYSTGAKTDTTNQLTMALRKISCLEKEVKAQKEETGMLHKKLEHLTGLVESMTTSMRERARLQETIQSTINPVQASSNSLQSEMDHARQHAVKSTAGLGDGPLVAREILGKRARPDRENGTNETLTTLQEDDIFSPASPLQVSRAVTSPVNRGVLASPPKEIVNEDGPARKKMRTGPNLASTDNSENGPLVQPRDTPHLTRVAILPKVLLSPPDSQRSTGVFGGSASAFAFTFSNPAATRIEADKTLEYRKSFGKAAAVPTSLRHSPSMPRLDGEAGGDSPVSFAAHRDGNTFANVRLFGSKHSPAAPSTQRLSPSKSLNFSNVNSPSRASTSAALLLQERVFPSLKSQSMISSPGRQPFLTVSNVSHLSPHREGHIRSIRPPPTPPASKTMYGSEDMAESRFGDFVQENAEYADGVLGQAYFARRKTGTGVLTSPQRNWGGLVSSDRNLLDQGNNSSLF